MTVSEAKATLASLEARLASTTWRSAENTTERRLLSFAAETGDADARKVLDAANKAAASLAIEVENLKYAIGEAKRHVTEAERAEERERERERARKVHELVAKAKPRAARIAAAARKLGDELAALNADLDEMRRLGAPVAGAALVSINFTKPLEQMLREAGLGFDLVPPHARHDLAELANGYISQADSWASRVLGGGSVEKEAA